MLKNGIIELYIEIIKDQIIKNIKYPTFQEYQNYLKQLQLERIIELKQNKKWNLYFKMQLLT